MLIKGTLNQSNRRLTNQKALLTNQIAAFGKSANQRLSFKHQFENRPKCNEFHFDVECNNQMSSYMMLVTDVDDSLF